MLHIPVILLTLALATPGTGPDVPLPVVVEEPEPPKKVVRPWIAGGLGLLVPGGGHFVLREPKTGLALIGTEGGLFALGVVGFLTAPQTCTTPPSPGCDPELDTRRIISRSFLPFAALQNVHIVGAYEAYRIARERAGPEGYRFPAPQSNLRDLALAPFQWSSLRRPVFWIPLALASVAGVLLSQIEPTTRALWERSSIDIWSRAFPTAPGFALGTTMYAATFWTVAAGEEAFFRGMLQTGLTEWLGPIGGILTASAIFGLAHYLNFADDPRVAWLAVAYSGSLGAYLGTLYYLDGHDLETPVALHFWYNLVVASAAFALSPDEQIFTVRVGFPF